MYCGVAGKVADEDVVKAGGVFPIPQVKLGRIKRLTGIDGVNKMSKSLGNAIFLTDDAKTVEKKCKKIFTGRTDPTAPGVVEGNVLFEYHEAFNADKARVAQLKELYLSGSVGDGAVKQELADAVNAFLEPIRQRRAQVTESDALAVLKAGTQRASDVAEATLWEAKKAAKFAFFERDLKLR
jgi:tryptophanyl-tRNA synthetase